MSVSELLPELPFTNPTLIFFIVLTIILFAPLLLNRLRIPYIIGLIIAGMVIGPNGFGLLLRDSSFEIFGKVGLLYLMFLAGLEIDINDFNKNKAKGLTFGMFTFTIPMLIGTVVSYYLLRFSLVTSVLLASMYASHTLVSYPIVSRYGVARTRPVTITIAGTVITDILALLILAVIAGMYRGEINQLFWIRLVFSVAMFCAVIVYAFPRLIRWFLKKYDDSVSQYIFVLALVFSAAFMAELAGLEGIIGAFLAGVVLNRYIPSVSPLMNRIEFVGNALFIPYFLIGVGMLIDLRVLFSNREALLVAAVMTVVATVAKWTAAWATQKTFRLPKVDRTMIFGLSNAQAAATLAAVLIGYNIVIGHDALGEPIRLLNENVLNGTIVMILVTCTISSFATEKAARELATRQQARERETQAGEREPRLLVPVANPATIENLMNLALLLRPPRREVPIYALAVTDDDKGGDGGDFRARAALRKAVSVASGADARVEPIARYDYNIASGILHTIKEKHVSEVVIGMHWKTNIVDTFLGSKTENLLKGTNRMVFITKCNTPPAATSRMVIAVPEKAEYETGFSEWVDRVANIARQLGCRAIFYAHPQTISQLKRVLQKGRYQIRGEFEVMENWDDLVLLSDVVLPDDLFIVVSARHTSISYSPKFDELPLLLARYFTECNLVVLYPEQFGKESEVVYFSDPMAVDVQRDYSRLIRLRHLLPDWLAARRKKPGRENRG